MMLCILVPVSTDVSEASVSEDKTDEELGLWLIVSRGQDVLLPPTQFNVTYLNPKDYGISKLNMIQGINGAQLFIQAHADVFGKENVTSAMTMRSDGWLYRFWDIDDMVDGYYITYSVNGRMPNVCANSVPMKEGDIMNVHSYKFASGDAVRSIGPVSQRILTGEDSTIYVSGASITDPDFTSAETPVWLWNEGGEDVVLGYTDRYGKFTYAFDEPGMYWVYSKSPRTSVGWAQIIVRDVYTESVEVDKEEIDLYVNETTNLSATVTPSNADVTGVQWSSSNKNVASVSADGTVKGLSPGRSIITVKTLDGDFVTSCEVTVRYDNSSGGSGGGGLGNALLYSGIGAIGVAAAGIFVFFFRRR